MVPQEGTLRVGVGWEEIDRGAGFLCEERRISCDAQGPRSPCQEPPEQEELGCLEVLSGQFCWEGRWEGDRHAFERYQHEIWSQRSRSPFLAPKDVLEPQC